MLIVIALLAIVATVTLPRLQEMYAKRTVAKAAHRFISHYGLARTTAMQYGRTSRLHLDAVSGRVWISVDTSLAGSGDTMTVEPPFDLTELGVGVTTTRSVFCFDPRGFPGRDTGCSDTPATITFDRGSTYKTLKISSGGRVQR